MDLHLKTEEVAQEKNKWRDLLVAYAPDRDGEDGWMEYISHIRIMIE